MYVDQTHTILIYLQDNKDHFKAWVERFILELDFKKSKNMLSDGGVSELVKNCRHIYSQVFEIDANNVGDFGGNIMMNSDELFDGNVFHSSEQQQHPKTGLVNAPNNAILAPRYDREINR